MEFDKWCLKDKVIMVWALLIASVALIFVLVSLGNLISDNSSNIASWVQAIGSIAAIIATWWITRSSYERHIEDRQTEEMQQRLAHLNSVKSVLTDQKKAMDNLTEKLWDTKSAPVKAMRGRFKSLGDILIILFEKGNFNDTDEILLKAMALNTYTIEAIGEIHSDGFQQIKATYNGSRTSMLEKEIAKLDAIIENSSNISQKIAVK